jgi:hypothetical protein
MLIKESKKKKRVELTSSFENLITLINDKGLDVAEAQVLVSNERVQTTRGGNNNVRALGLVLNKVNVLLSRGTTVKNSGANIRQVFGETRVLVLNLVGQLTGVAKNHNRDFTINRFNLLKSGKHENSSLTKTRLGLADNVSA